MRRLTAVFASFALAGCVTGIPDADLPFKPAKNHPCEKWIIVQPGNEVHCMTEQEFARWVRRNLP